MKQSHRVGWNLSKSSTVNYQRSGTVLNKSLEHHHYEGKLAKHVENEGVDPCLQERR